MKASDLIPILSATAECMGGELTPIAAEMLARDLAGYSDEEIATALTRCRRELTGKLSLARVLERLPGQHIGADEAWALCPRSEDDTAVWTHEIAQAFWAAKPLLDEGDQVAARMAFKDSYAAMLAQTNGARPQWEVSRGHSERGRVAPIMRAVHLGRLPASYAEENVGHLLGAGEVAALRLSSGAGKLGDVLKLPGTRVKP